MGGLQRTEGYDDERSEPELEAELRILHSPDTAACGRRLPLGASLTVGRAGADLTLLDTKLSRRHATVRRLGGGGFEVEDHDSRNGTWVEGERIGRCGLELGALVRVGETLLELGFDDGAPDGFAWDAELIGRSAPLYALLSDIDRVAARDASVLIVGETGAGKELVARRLHQSSGRNGPLVAVNCGAMPATLIESALFGHKKGAFTSATTEAAGYFRSAQGGTLFLDEIGVLPLELQPKLLRVLENREIVPVGATTPQRSDARVLAATNVNIGAEAAAGRFRRDLYARLAEYTLHVPPLRERRGDIPLLARHFLARFAPERSFTFTAAFLEALLLHDWPMNVRELRAVMQRIAIDAKDTVLRTVPLPPPQRVPVTEVPPREELEALLARHRGNVAKVAQHYGKARMQMYRWLARHAIDAEKYRRG